VDHDQARYSIAQQCTVDVVGPAKSTCYIMLWYGWNFWRDITATWSFSFFSQNFAVTVV